MIFRFIFSYILGGMVELKIDSAQPRPMYCEFIYIEKIMRDQVE